MGRGLDIKEAAAGAAAPSEGELRRLNWALRAYARSSAALIHFQTLEGLVASLCDAIVGEGQYVLAAVALPENGPGRPIRLLAGAGAALGYIDGLVLSWRAGAPGGDGPAGRCVRSGQPMFMRDALTEPMFEPWRERARRFGIRSSVTVPFKRDGRVIGVFMIYGQAPDAFGPQEVALFDELGAELAFAMGLIEERQRLKAAEEARLAAEAATREAQAELARVARHLVVGEFASSIAHELNQPIAAVATNCDAGLRWLDRDPPNLDMAREALRRGLRDAHRAADVVKRTRAMLTREEPRFAAVDLNEALSEVLLFTQAQQRRAGVRIRLDLAPDLPVAWGDRVQLQQVMVNLVINGLEALKPAGGRGGSMTLRTAPAAEGQVMVEVADRGPGLDSAAVERLFEPFVTTKAGGMGLGLAISRSIIEAHGGRIWA
ncbi:MAG: GAF domain-containing protein, partial [Proteobacteria bacterium]|nr:GAF domain-containing protein [Pseudomonadota bacterium]